MNIQWAAIEGGLRLSVCCMSFFQEAFISIPLDGIQPPHGDSNNHKVRRNYSIIPSDSYIFRAASEAH